MRLDSFFSGALCVMSGGRLPAALFLVFLLDPKGAYGYMMKEERFIIILPLGKHSV